MVTVVLLSALLPLVAPAVDPLDLAVDPLSDTAEWRLSGHYVNYVLGSSSLAASRETHRDGFPAALKLTYDFAEPQRSYLSLWHVGGAIPGLCRQLSVQVHGDGTGGRLRLTVEDARGRWFTTSPTVVDFTGWRQVTVPINEGWTPLLRRGEERLPLLQPIALRELAYFRAGPKHPNGALYFQDLRARVEQAPADLLTATLSTGEPGNLLILGRPGTLRIELNGHGASVAGELSLTVTDYFGRTERRELPSVTVPAEGVCRAEVPLDTTRLGTFEAVVTLVAGGRERRWAAPYAVSAPLPERPEPDASHFGIYAYTADIRSEQRRLAVRLARESGLRWTRFGAGWQELNPGPGQWAWDGPQRVDGPVGRAWNVQGRPYSVAHRPSLDCRDGLTIAFWSKLDGSNGTWQWPLGKPGNGEADRAYGVFFNRDDGVFCFTAGFAREPGVGHRDLSAGVSGWDGRWHHYAVTYAPAAKVVVMYVDGQLRATHPCDRGPLRANAGPLRLGDAYPGQLDEVLLYDRALGAEAIRALAAKGTPPADGLVAGWSFEDAGPIIRDRSPNHFDLSNETRLAQEARTARADGMATLAILGFPPRWASTAPPGAGRPWVYAPEVKAWAEYVEQTVRHHRDRVHAWEIWNEPNITVFWEPKPDAKAYFELLRVAYQAAKRADPGCTVIMPGLAGPFESGGMEYLTELLQLGAARYCDAIAIHPYRQATPEASDLVGQLTQLERLAEANGGHRPFWYTEMCWTNQLPGGSTEARTARMLARCHVLSLGSGLVDRIIWFRLHDSGPDRFYTEHNYGLCYQDLTPKPALLAQRTCSLLLDEAVPDGTWDVGPNALARCFRNRGERVAAVWAPQGTATVALRLGTPSARLVDLMGNERTVPTRAGVLLLEAGEDVQFVRGLTGQAAGRGTPLAVEPTSLWAGGRAPLRLKLRNPFGTEQSFRLRITATAPLVVTAPETTVTVPADGTREVAVEVSAAPAAGAGWQTLTVAYELAGRSFAQPVRVPVRGARPDAGPVGWWRLDEGQGTTFADASGGGHSGELRGATWAPGRQGAALHFDGTQSAVIPDAPALNLRDEVTVALWLKVEGSTGTWQFPLTKDHLENVRRNYVLYLKPERFEPCFSGSFEQGTYRHHDVPSPVTLDDHQWHHVAASYSLFDGRVKLYVDGRPAGEAAFDYGALLTTPDPLRLGVGFKGWLDDVRVWPRVLPAGEVARLAAP